MYERTSANDARVNSTGSSAYNEEVYSAANAKSATFLGKVYGYMAILVFITFAVALGVGYGLYYGILNAIEGGNDQLASNLIIIGVVGLIASLIVMLICSIIISFKSIRQQSSIAVPGIIFAICFGIGISFISLVATEVNPWIIPAAFAITGLAFALMFLITRKAKNLNSLAIIGLTLLFGSLLLGSLFFIIYLINVVLGVGFMSEAAYTMFVILDSVIFIAMILFIAVDIHRITKIAEGGSYNKNLPMYCAFWLYQDFMYVMLKVMKVLLYIAAKSKK